MRGRPYHGKYSSLEYLSVHIFLHYKLSYLLYFLFLWVGDKILKNKNRFAFYHFFHFFYHYHFCNNNYYLFILFNFLLDLKKWLKNLTWCQVGSSNDSNLVSRSGSRSGSSNASRKHLEHYDQSLYKTTWRNINIALLSNLAVSESYNINDIVFLIVVALGKLISYFDWN